MAFTEFYIRTNGNNTNSGSTNNPNSISSGINGAWNNTGLWYKAPAGTFIGVTPNVDFASIYIDGASSGSFVGLITSVVSDTGIYLSSTANFGINPASANNGMSVKVGGALLGPNTTNWYPLPIFSSNARNANSDIPRLNMQSGTYIVTLGYTTLQSGPFIIQGYNTIPGDSGVATIKGPTTGSAIGLITVNVNGLHYIDLIIDSNGATGAANLFTSSGASVRLRRILFKNSRGRAFNLAGGGVAEECEAVNCNQSNTANIGIVQLSNGKASRCIVHDNFAGRNCDGFLGAGQFDIDECIAYNNGGHGFFVNSTVAGGALGLIRNCDFVNNSGDGIRLDSAANSRFLITIENSNFVLNSGYGINVITYARDLGILNNCGTYLNANNANSGYLNTDGWFQEGLVLYTGIPYVDYLNGDFSVILPEAINTGRGYFPQMVNYNKQSKSVVSIGAVQPSGSSGGSTVTNIFYGPSASRIVHGV